jgi:hypothetical protein
VVSPVRRHVVEPLAPERYKLQVTMNRTTHELLRRAQDLLRHQIPSGDPAAIVERALTLLVAELERTKLAATTRPRASDAVTLSSSRYVPAPVRRAVWQRDGGRCAFVGSHGRCREAGFLELHHVVPHAVGGKATADNLAARGESSTGIRPAIHPRGLRCSSIKYHSIFSVVAPCLRGASLPSVLAATSTTGCLSCDAARTIELTARLRRALGPGRAAGNG